MTMMHDEIRQSIVGDPKHGIAGIQDDWWTRISPDLWQSKGIYLKDISGIEYLDFCGFLGTAPLRFDHPELRDPLFLKKLGQLGFYRPSLSDFWTRDFADFIQVFREMAVPPYMQYLYFIEGGALANENALKAAFDWKVKLNIKNGSLKFPVDDDRPLGTTVIGFNNAFHGRSGYTLSLTRTNDPRKYRYFPKFNWFRLEPPVEQYDFDGNVINNKEIEEKTDLALRSLVQYLDMNHHAVAAIIIEPIQCEGGERHIPIPFFQSLKEYADQYECLLIYDEVQTGFGTTGKMWAHEYFGKEAVPDMISFAKKAQTSGIMASMQKFSRIEDHVFSDFEEGKSRLNSTWGGNMVDMLRCGQILKAIHLEKLLENAENVGAYLLNGLRELCIQFPNLIENPRGRGMLLAIDTIPPLTNKFLWSEFYKGQLLSLVCGEKTVRFRPHLDLEKTDVDESIHRMAKALNKLK